MIFKLKKILKTNFYKIDFIINDIKYMLLGLNKISSLIILANLSIK